MSLTQRMKLSAINKIHCRFSLIWKWLNQKFQSEFRILTVSSYNGYGQGTCLWNIYHCVSNTSFPDRSHWNFLFQRIRQPDGAYQDLNPEILSVWRRNAKWNFLFQQIFIFLTSYLFSSKHENKIRSYNRQSQSWYGSNFA